MDKKRLESAIETLEKALVEDKRPDEYFIESFSEDHPNLPKIKDAYPVRHGQLIGYISLALRDLKIYEEGLNDDNTEVN